MLTCVPKPCFEHASEASWQVLLSVLRELLPKVSRLYSTHFPVPLATGIVVCVCVFCAYMPKPFIGTVSDLEVSDNTDCKYRTLSIAV